MMIKTEDYKREILFIFFSQRLFIFKITLIIFIASVSIALFWPPTYAAYGSFLLKSKELHKSPSVVEDIQVRQEVLKKEDLASEIEIFIANETIDKTLKRLQKEHPNKDYANKKVSSILKHLKTEILPASNVIKVTYTAKNSESAKELLETLMDEYIRARLDVINSESARGFFSEQVQEYAQELEGKEKILHDLVGTTKVSNPEKQIESNIFLIKDFENILNGLETQAISKRYLIKHLKKSLKSKKIQTFTFINNASLNHLSTSLMDVYSESAQILKDYKPESEKYQGIQRQLKSLHELLVKEVVEYQGFQQAELNTLEKQIKKTQTKINHLNTNNVTLHKQIIDTNRILRESGILTSTLETFAKRREEANVNSIASDANLYFAVNIIDKAYASSDPIYPKKTMTMVLGLIVGFITGCCLGFIRHYFDHTFKSVLDVDRYLAMPVLFSIEDYSNINTKNNKK